MNSEAFWSKINGGFLRNDKVLFIFSLISATEVSMRQVQSDHKVDQPKA